MIFEISRTSLDYTEKPCDEAYKSMVIWKDERIVSTPDELKMISERKEWYNKGFNHRVENECIIRDFEKESWVVEIKDLKHLLKFVALYGEIIIFGSKIEIFDDYR